MRLVSKIMPAFVICGFIVAWLGGIVFYKFILVPYTTPADIASSRMLTVPIGATASQVRTHLEDLGYQVPELVFKLQLKISGVENSLQAGDYMLPPYASVQDILRILSLGLVIQYRLTIPEGFQSRDVIARLNETRMLVGPDIKDLEEGVILPETYHFARGTSRHSLLEMMQIAQQRFLAHYNHENIPQPLQTFKEVITLASLVESETHHDHERPLVARVFLNRLIKGIKLQSDPTVVHALERINNKKLDRALSRKDLAIKSQYNTYLVHGLPPSPLCNPGKKSLDAVMNPAHSEMLFFISDGKGRHIFSKTYDDHQKYHKALRSMRKKQSEKK